MKTNQSVSELEVPNDTLAIDSFTLTNYLKKHIEGLSSSLQIEKFTGGQSNPTYLIRSGTRSFVLRRRPPGEILSSAHQVGREALVMNALRQTNVPVPKILHHCEDTSIIGQEFYVMDYLNGRIFWDPTLPECSNNERRDIYFSLVDELANLHAVSYDNIGLEKFGPNTNYYQRQIERWGNQYKAVGDPIKDMDWLIDWLSNHLPEHQDTCIVHGDYRLDNAIFDHSESKIIGLIDWELSTLGCPLADLSYFTLGWIVPLNSRSGQNLTSSDLELLGIPNIDEIHARYFETSKIRRPDNFSFYHTYNLFRLTCILHGIAARAKNGNASNSNATELGKLVPIAAAGARAMASNSY